MNENNESAAKALGLMRSALLALALLNVIMPLLHYFLPFAAGGEEPRLWEVLATVIAPVMAPLFAVLLLFDYIMSRVRAADASGIERLRFIAIARIELGALLVTLLFWVPYFIWLL